MNISKKVTLEIFPKCHAGISKYYEISFNIRYLSFDSEPIELDYFEKALDFLISQSKVDSKNGIGISGASKGGELALSMASILPQSKIGAVLVQNAIMVNSVTPLIYKKETILSGKQNSLSMNFDFLLNIYEILI